jgi:hypothetical protein
MIECDFLRDSQQSDLMENIIRAAVVPHPESNLHFAAKSAGFTGLLGLDTCLGIWLGGAAFCLLFLVALLPLPLFFRFVVLV